MHVFEITEALDGVPGAAVKIRRGAVTVHVPAIGDTVELSPDEIVDAASVFVPTGAPAVQLDVRRGREVLPLIITVDDVVFSPAYADDLIAPGTHLSVPAMPGMIAYSEMHRDVRALGRTIDNPDVTLDPETLAATLLAHRCFLAGAMRVGLWPVRVAAWWEYSESRARARDVPLTPMAEDPSWDDLMESVAEARSATAADQA